MEKRVKKALFQSIGKDVVLERPKDKSMGHFATPVAFSLAKELRKSPIHIATELAEKLNEEPIFHSVEAVKGFINIKLSEAFLEEYATWALKHEDKFGSEDGKEKVLLEYVSANPTGPLHIGHARGAVFGDALARVGKHLGYDITTEYYVNDAGNQIRLLGVSIYLAGREHILKTEVEYPEEYYKGEYIIDVAKSAHEKFGDDIFSSEDNIEKLSIFGKEQMLELIKSNMSDVGIEFDNYVSEKSLYNKWDESLEKLKSRDGIYEKDEKLWLKSTEHGDDNDRVVVRENKIPTYLAGDIIYHDNKYSRDYDRYINIWGADHHGYITRVKSAITYLGYDSSKLEVLLAQMVALLKNGEPYKMSKRAGNFILMSDVVEEIGSDALRFIFLSKKSDTHLEFDVEAMKAQDSSNPIFYINYAHTRVHSLFNKAEKSFEDVYDVSFDGISEEGKSLLFDALTLPKILNDAFESRQMLKVTDYLQALAASVHKYYNENKVVGSENQDRELKLFAVAALSLRVGLRLLGIEAKTKMYKEE